jgi:hypothetical protein
MPRDTLPTQEADNQEQNDTATQAQTVADEARGRNSGDPAEDSEHGGSPDRTAITPDDAPDLIDRMEQMVSSGVIDYDAFRGEPAHDDEADSYGADVEEIDAADLIDRDE